MPMGSFPTNVPVPQLGQVVYDTIDNDGNAIVTSLIRYNGEGYFVCGVHSNTFNTDYQMDVRYNTIAQRWESRHYMHENRLPDLDGTIKRM